MAAKTGKAAFEVLLPTGLMVAVTLDAAKCTFGDIKSDAWKAAKKLPLFALLGKEDLHGLKGISMDGASIEYDDSLPVKNASLYANVLKAFERRGDKAAQKLDTEIGSLINIRLSEFENSRDEEVKIFRQNIMQEVKAVVDERARGGAAAQEMYHFPPNLDESPLPPHLTAKLTANGTVHVKVQLNNVNPKDGKVEMSQLTLNATVDGTAEAFIRQVLERKARNTGATTAAAKDNAADFVLKVTGRDEYIHGPFKLSQFVYIRKCLATMHEAKAGFSDTVLILRKRSELQAIIQKDATADRIRSSMSEPPPLAPQQGIEFLWFTQRSVEAFKIKIVEATNVQTGKLFGVGVLAAVYLGDTLLCQERTRYITPSDIVAGQPVQWGQTLSFEFALKDLPRDARLCLSIHGVWANPLTVGKKKKKDYRNDFPLAWANMSIFDFKRKLRTGTLQLATWPYEDDATDELIKPLGTTVQKSGVEDKLPVLTIEFPSFSHCDVYFPESARIGNKSDGQTPFDLQADQRLDIEHVEAVVLRDPLYQLNDQDRALLRKYRYYQRNEPRALAKCLRAIDWSRNEATHEVADMLRHWAPLTPEIALDLLDAGFMDGQIRSHAVKALRGLTDNQLIAYLLQLTQVLKYEAYLDCDLARFLLRRALGSQRVGHFFFWYLRSEMHIPEASVRFGLLLEAYCRGCGSHMQELAKQSTAMEKLAKIAESIKPKNFNKPQKLKMAQDQLAAAQLGEFQLPLDPAYRLAAVECPRVMDSKKLPVWLTFTNADEPSHQINIIFKDMLTLQLIRIMDQLWQSAGLDLQMHPYGCLSTGDQLGMIEVVMNARTIAGIQGGMRAAMADDPLFKWLQKMNPKQEDLDKAVDSFLLSCAGYCVATYVLGIGDRHNDNIMVTKMGQLFHIDFGHFLGNWKSKLGVKRERVKFILTPDFVYALSKGEGQRSDQFLRFKNICRDAYLIVRKQANVFINLLNMMLSTGIPELKSHQDVDYLRTTLCLDMSDAAAAESFMNEIDTALKDSWSVRVNWAVHIAAH